ncbi:MAG: tRNA-binding protein [Cyclobacteriaceae bacterium]|jgi:tRNA-binding protein
MPNKSILTWDDFAKIDMRIGTIVEAHDFQEAKKPAYKLIIDFGNEIGIRKSSAQITTNYSKQELVGKQIAAVINFPPKQIGPIKSECLVLGSYQPNGSVILLSSDQPVISGLKVG